MAQKRHANQLSRAPRDSEPPTCYCYYYCYYRRLRSKGVKQKQGTPDGTPAEEDEESCYPSVVRIVLAGGVVEVYPNVVPASEVMEKHPGLCVTRPEVFTRPQESLVGPTEKLLPGEKFYLVPHTTVRKLRERQGMQQRSPGQGLAGGHREVESPDSPVVVAEEAASGNGEEIADDDEMACSAKDFYVSKERWRQCASRRRPPGKAGARETGKQPLPPLPTTKAALPPPPATPRQCCEERGGRGRGRGLPTPQRRKFSRRGVLGWKPSLVSITEISP